MSKVLGCIAVEEIKNNGVVRLSIPFDKETNSLVGIRVDKDMIGKEVTLDNGSVVRFNRIECVD